MFKKNVIIFIALLCLSFISLSACILSYWRLDVIPYGFHVDELSGAVDIGCMLTEGVDAHNVPYPFFSNLNYGTPKPPTFIYLGMLWAKIFGYSVASLRSLSVTVHLLGIAGLFLLARLLFGSRYALITITVASLSPWTWGLSRIGFESMFAVSFLIWGIYLFLKSPKLGSTILAGLFFVAAIYSYPPFRLQTPLMILTLIIYSLGKTPRRGQAWIVFFTTIALPLIPLVQKTLSGEIQKRFNAISIFSKDYLTSIHSSGHLNDILHIFINNFFLHFNGDFLFLTGDPSLVHSTRHFGILGWLDASALFFGLAWMLMLSLKKSRKDNPLVVEKNLIFFLLINILIGVLPSALTNSELPNSLRITGAWPFWCLLSGYLIWQTCERWWGGWILAVVLSSLFTVMYFNIYFRVFPQEGKGMFGYWTLDDANGSKNDDDWLKFMLKYRHQDYNARYFLMQYRGITCTESRLRWEGLRDYLLKQGTY